jgi:transcription antitermination factor NusG
MTCRTVFSIPSNHITAAGEPWFALRVRTGCEKTATCLLGELGYERFLPVYSARRRWSDRVQTVELPLFPGYVFSRFALADRLTVLKVSGVIHIVGVGRTPVPVDNAEIASIQAIINSGLAAQPWPFVRIGDAVLIEDGPLRGVEGIVSEVTKRCRLVVSVTLLQRSVAVEFDHDWVRRISRSSQRLPAQAVSASGDHSGWRGRIHFSGRPSQCA